MNIVQMLVAFVVVIVGDHLIGLTFEAHTFIASATGHSETAINSYQGHLARFIWALSDSILFHVSFKEFVTSFFGFFTRKIRMIFILNFTNVIPCNYNNSSSDKHHIKCD
jgi:hypothetical protein